MKSKSSWLGALLMIALAITTARAADAGSGDASRPRIQGIRLDADGVAVTVMVPPGVRKVTLESRTRLGRGAWVPRAVHRLDGQGGEVVFRLAKSEALEVLRVRGDSEEPLPLSFYAGKSDFAGPAATSRSAGFPGGGPVFDMESGAPTAGGGTSAPRDVVESDIWRLRGDRLFFFNQYRGLQVLDLKQPEAPRVEGTLPLAAAGEQMYVVANAAGADFAVLLARNGCGWSLGDESQVLVIDPAGPGTPRIAATVKLPGYIVESRLVGSALYVASQSYRRTVLPPKPGSAEAAEQWEYGTVVTSVDLANPTAPQSRDQLWFAGYGNVIQATDRFLFVVVYDQNNWWQSAVQVVDITSPDGAMKAAGSVRATGRVADKFKMNLSGDVLTVISEVARWSPSGRQLSVLETFSLAEPMTPRKLGQLELGHGEGLYATRFDGDRAYIVTFLRVDPLWVVDLKDPAHPRIAGELEVPGWSNYIHPLGDKLVTIGNDSSNNWRVAVSLFDVKDPAKPALLAKVPLGSESSWSEANWDEKAFSVLPGSGLILVPYQDYGKGGTAARVQLIDLGADSLKARGVIEHALQPRRATVHGDRILSVSGREFLSVDAADRDHPKVAAELELSWPVDRVLAAGGYLLEFGGSQSWSDRPAPAIRVASTAKPDEALSRVALREGLPVIAATVRGESIIVVQGETWWNPLPGQPGLSPVEPKTQLRVTTFALGSLPELKPLGVLETEIPSLDWIGQMQTLWPNPDLLVLASAGGGWGRYWPMLDMAMPVGGWWPWWGGGGGRLIAFDLTDPAAPKLASDLKVGSDNQGWGFSQAHTAGGLVYLSHQASEFIEGITLPGQTPPQPYEVVKPDGTKEMVTPPVGVWVTKHYLNVVDFTDASSPTVRKAVNLPGQLIGLAQSGALLFTAGPHWDDKWQTDWIEYVDACAYDGVSASLVASLKQSADWPRARVVADGTVFLASKSPAPATSGLIEAWRLGEAGAFTRRGEIALSSPASDLKALGTLLVAQTDRGLQVVDTANPAAMTIVGRGQSAGCTWPDLSLAVGESGSGVWVPLGAYGLLAVPLTAAP